MLKAAGERASSRDGQSPPQDKELEAVIDWLCEQNLRAPQPPLDLAVDVLEGKVPLSWALAVAGGRGRRPGDVSRGSPQRSGQM